MAAPLSSISVAPAADAVDTTTPNTTTTAPLTNKAVVSKSPYSLGTPSGNVGVDPALLENMQQLIAEREAKKNSFMESMKDATAWWSGGMAGPGAALAARAKDRDEFDATTFGMKRDLAQNKIAQQQAQADAASLTQAITGGGGAGGAGGAGGGQTPPPLVANEILRLIKANRIEDAKARYNTWLTTESGNISKSTYDASANVQQPTFIDGIGSIQLNTNQARNYENTGELPSTISPTIREKARALWQQAHPEASTTAQPQTGNALPHVKPLQKIGAPTDSIVTTTTPDAVRGNAVEIATALNVPIISGDRSTPEQKAIYDESVAAGRPGRTAAGNPIAKPGTSNHEKGNAIDVDSSKFTEDDARKLVQAGFKQRKDDKNHWDLVGATASTASLPQQKAELRVNAANPVTTTANAPSAAVNDSASLPFPNPKNPKEEEVNNKFIADRANIPLESAKTEATTFAGETGKDLAQLKKDNDRAASTMAAAKRVIALADDPKLNKVMGWMHGGDATATYLGAVPKFAASLVGQGENLEETAKNLAWTGDKDLLAADQRLKTDSTQLGIEYTANMFKGARLGIGLEKLGLKGKGVSNEYLPQVNKLYAQLALDGAEFEVKKNRAFEQWKGNNPAKTYGAFLSTPGYEKMLDDERALLESRYPGIEVKVLDKPSEAGHKATKSGVKYRIHE